VIGVKRGDSVEALRGSKVKRLNTGDIKRKNSREGMKGGTIPGGRAKTREGYDKGEKGGKKSGKGIGTHGG